MDAAVSCRFGHEAVEEKPRALVVHHRRLQGPSIGDIAFKVEKGNPQQDKENMRMESLSSEPDSSSASFKQNEQNDRLESARAEMGEVKEENERLKMYLHRIMREYKVLQMHFFDTVKQGGHDLDHDKKKMMIPDEEHNHVSLSLGPTGSVGSSLERNYHDDKNKAISSNNQKNNLELSLDWKLFEGANNNNNKSGTATNYVSSSPINLSPENSFEDQKEETGELRPPSKVQKTAMSGNDDVSQQKKTRVSVRARCDTPTMNDGCQWRKYGQKTSKGNPCPRAYYRCTIAPSCPVRKQVQRCADDMSILITTYEGTHNHPLPVSATSMASMTSAAASMLLSASSSTTSGSSHGLNPNATTDLCGLNYYLSDPSRSKQFYLPNTTSMASGPTHPTITLDLTNSNPNSSTNNSLSHFNRFTSNNVRSPVIPTRSSYNLSTTSVRFGSPEPTSALPISWGNGSLLSNNYGNALHQFYPKSQPQENFLHRLHQPQDNSIAAATKVITADPNFQSALAAALKSIIGGNTAAAMESGLRNHLHEGGGGDGLGQTPRWNDNLINVQSTLQSAGCGSSFLNSPTLAGTNTHQLRNLRFGQPSFSSLPLANPKSNGSSTTSPSDNMAMDHSKLL